MLDLLLDDALDDKARADLEAHAGVCPECAAKLRAAEQLKAILNDALPEADVPLAAQAKWRAAVRAEAAEVQKRRKRGLTRTIGSVAAAAVVLVGVGIAINGGLTGLNPAGRESTPDATSVPKAETVQTEPVEASEEIDALEETEEELVLLDDAAIPMDDEPLDEVFDDSETALADDEELLLDGDFAMPMESFEDAGIPAAESAAGGTMAFMADENAAILSDESFAISSSAFLETDGLEDFDAVSGAPDLPMQEWHMMVDDVEAACASVRDLLDEYEGEAEEQRSGDTANLYISLPAENLADFASAIAHLDLSGASEEWAVDAEGDTASVLLILSAKA